MNYELAKKLKDVGLPQTGDFYWCALTGTLNKVFCKFCLSSDMRDFGSYERLCIDPSLSELIEACKDRFNSLATCGGDKKWAAQGGGEEEFADTPEEAVANLWLALNTAK